MVWIPLFNVPWVTKDGGKTWMNSTGAPNDVTGYLWTWNGGNWHQWNNDRVNGDYWYIYKGPNFYVSCNGGLTWKSTNNIGWYENAQPYVQADFEKEGHVAYGQTFGNVKGVNKSRIVKFGPRG